MTIKKKRLLNILGLLLLLTAAVQCMAPALRASASSVPAPPIVNAESVFIMEGRTGEELYSKKADEPVATDSLLPMLVAMVVADARNIDDFILISEDAQGMNTKITGTNGDAGLTAGERLTIRQVLSAVLLANSQDATRALAADFEPSQDFLGLIQAKVLGLELKGTSIESYLTGGEASGKTTVRDMALAMQAFLDYPQLVAIAQQPSYTFIPNNMVPEPRIIENSNAQVVPGDDEYMSNALAGFLSEGTYQTFSFNMFVSGAEHSNSQFITALSNSSKLKENFSDSRALFDWAGNNYRSTHLISKGEVLSYLPLENGSNLELTASKDIYFLAPRDMTGEPDFSLNFKPLDLSGTVIELNQVMGTADIVVTERTVATLDLLAESAVSLTEVDDDVPEDPVWIRTLRWLGLFLIMILILAIIVLIIRTINKLRRTRHRIRKIQSRQEQLIQEQEEIESLTEDQQVINRSNF